jgi:molybdopterin synthase sulfur carrier subunit
MKNFLASLFSTQVKSRHEIEIVYFGRPSELLMMTSERMVIPSTGSAIAQVLALLRQRGGRWAHELDDSHVICTVNGRAVSLHDTLRTGDEMGLFSSKSWLEV